MRTLFQALPAYFGGKRRLCRAIFALLSTVLPPARWRELTFIDPFLGGGSVSLYAKARGLRVLCNDIALRSAAVGRAIIQNSTVTLSEADIALLLRKPRGRHASLATARYSPSVFPRPHAVLLNRALHNLRTLPEPKRSLAILVLVKWALRIQPMSMLRGTDARAAFGGDLDRVSARRLGHYLNADRLLTFEAWWSLAQEINAAVFPGRGQASQADALDFLTAAVGDVVYLDPPYPSTTSYEKEYAVLDDLLEGTTRPPSEYSRSSDSLHVLLRRCSHVPVWLISLNNAVLSEEELLELVRPHRPHVRAIALPYRHLNSIASEVKNETNREFIVVATN